VLPSFIQAALLLQQHLRMQQRTGLCRLLLILCTLPAGMSCKCGRMLSPNLVVPAPEACGKVLPQGLHASSSNERN
jgi:hypothetical protein